MIELIVSFSNLVAGVVIPPEYSGAGRNVSPPLTWSAVPAHTRSIAVLCDDPDAPVGDWVHWVAFNIPAGARGLAAGVPRAAKLPDGTVQGLNDYNRNGYDGPCPPPGKPHRYFYKVFALDSVLALGPGARKKDLLKAIEGHVLARGQWWGTFQR